MKINIYHTPEGAKKATGLIVIIDVFRAFSTECYVMHNGASKIIPVGNLDEALHLKSQNPDFILMGEQQGEIPPGFDFGNSPFQIMGVDFVGKTVVHISTAGTKGLANAPSSSTILTGSFVNASAIIRYVKQVNPIELSLVCTGTTNETIMDEDALCALFIKNEILGIPNDFPGIVTHLKDGGYIDRFLDPKIPKYPPEDVDCCLDLDKFNFVLKVTTSESGLRTIEKIIV